MRLALQLARRGCGTTSPNPMVGAVLVRGGKVIGRGWHRRAGGPHAEIEALRDAERRGHSAKGATLYVTLEPCCTHGRTPPCTDAIIAAGIRRVVVGATDPNPKHVGRGFEILRAAGIEAELLAGEREHRLPSANRRSGPGVSPVRPGTHGRDARATAATRHSAPMPGRRETSRRASEEKIAEACSQLNETFNYWIVHRTPFVTVKAAMTLDGKIATASGESKWITGEQSRAFAMKLRQASDAILVGINTVLADDPSLTIRSSKSEVRSPKPLRRIILDSRARSPLTAKVVSDEHAALTTVVVSPAAPQRRVAALAKKVRVLVVPKSAIRNPQSAIPLRWLLRRLGAENVTSLLVEGGGEVNASFLFGGHAQRIAFFCAPKILGGRDARKAVAGDGARSWSEILRLTDPLWRRLGPDLLLTARVAGVSS